MIVKYRLVIITQMGIMVSMPNARSLQTSVDKWFPSTLYNDYDCLAMLGFKLIYIWKEGPMMVFCGSELANNFNTDI